MEETKLASGMIAEMPFAVLIAGAVLVGLWWANFFIDSGIDFWRSRKLGHAVGGVGYLLCVLIFSTVWWPLIISIGFTLLLLVAHFKSPRLFRGVGGISRPGGFAEVWFPLSSTVVLAISWGIFNRPMIAIACILMMAWGDCLGGWVRAFKYDKPTKGIEGSVVTFLVCLIIAWCFVSPFWVGALAALAATITEYVCGDVGKIHWLDDNLAIPLVSLAVILPLS